MYCRAKSASGLASDPGERSGTAPRWLYGRPRTPLGRRWNPGEPGGTGGGPGGNRGGTGGGPGGTGGGPKAGGARRGPSSDGAPPGDPGAPEWARMSSPADPLLTALRLAGRRAALRPTRAADARIAAPLLAGELLRFVPWRGPASLAELERAYAEWRRPAAGGCDYRLAIEERDGEAFAGSIELRCAGHPGTGQVGYWIAPDRQGRGLATESVRLVAHLAFEHLALTLLVARTAGGNHASRRVLEKAGFACDAETRVEGADGPRHELHMSCTRRTWRRERATWPEPEIDAVELDPRVTG